MKKVFSASLFALLVSVVLAYMILFEGKFEIFEKWWDHQTRGSASIPFSPYKKYRKDSAFLFFEEANSIQFMDRHLFWKGSGAIAKPELTQDHKLIKIHMVSGGYGYSNQVEAKVFGAGSHEFELGPVSVENGSITSVSIKKTGKWNLTPLAYHGNDKYPFSGTIEKKFKNGLLFEEIQFLSGKQHGKHLRYAEKGIPVFSHDYVHGKKHGTHIYWFSSPLDPDNYVSKGETKYPSLWMEINEKAKNKFRKNYGKSKSNEWVLSKYRLEGGSFGVKLLEHWHENLKHGLFEGFDDLGNKTFKDEYKYGLRIKHKTFDKTKGNP